MKKTIASSLIALMTLTAISSAKASTAQATNKKTNVQEMVLKVLNQKNNAIRGAVLKAHADSCIELSSECHKAQDAYSGKTDYTFTSDDIAGIVSLGQATEYDPCKQEKCFGTDVFRSEYAVLVKKQARSRWASNPLHLTLVFSLIQAKSQQTGAIKRSIDLSIARNDFAQ